jgi:2-methylcitrate dehydratase PrpD
MEQMEQLTLALFNTEWPDFSEDSIRSAKLVFLDTLGALIAGIQQKESVELAKSFADNGDYSILGTRYKTNLYNAGLIHGSASVATEMDEGNQYSKGHPAAHVVPVLLTMLQNRENITGKQLLEFLIKGYEVCSRFGRASKLLPDAHAHGTWGVVGATATALLVENVSQSDFREGLSLSATFALPTMWKAALDGKLVRNIYAGHAIEMGIKTVAFLKTNHLAPEENISHVFSSVVGVNFNPNELDRDKEDAWDIELNYFKPYAFCRYAHAPIDAFQAIIDQHQLNSEDISTINVYTYQRAATLASQHYTNILSSKFSIPFALSVLIHKQRANQSIFTEMLYEDKDIKEFAEKVFVHYLEDLEKEYPKIMPALVEVIDIRGNTYKQRIDIAKGGPGKRFTGEEVIGKFNHLTTQVFSKETQEKIVQFIMNLEEEEEVAPLLQLCITVKEETANGIHIG